MKYAMKMVLIPESEYRRLKPDITDKMNQVLSRKHDQETATDMSQLFGRYLRTKQTHNPIQSLDKTHILSKLPAIYHAKVSKFLTFLEDYGSSWMDTYEFVSKNGEVIGNIIDLLNQAFVAKKKGPSPGWKKFITEIINANVPMNIFTKTSTKQDIEQELTKRENRQFTEEWENY